MCISFGESVGSVCYQCTKSAFMMISLVCCSKEFDKKYNPTWHCIVGRNFGSYVTHETKHFIYFYLGQVAILLFKSGWNQAWAHLHLTIYTDWRKKGWAFLFLDITFFWLLFVLKTFCLFVFDTLVSCNICHLCFSLKQWFGSLDGCKD